MKGPLSTRFEATQKQGRAAFIPFVTGCFPDEQTCLGLIRGLDAAGADIIEVGIPFSDPVADGPVIQATSERALAKGVTPRGVLDMIAEVSMQVDAALVIMSYWNPIRAMGVDVFAERASLAGVAGAIVPDLPPEEAEEWMEAAGKAGIDTVFMAAPPTPMERVASICKACRGFLYYVSMTGVTGADLKAGIELTEKLARIKEATDLPVAVGFGVAKPEQAAMLSRHADGVIVGSALMRCVLDAKTTAQGMDAALALAGDLRAAM